MLSAVQFGIVLGSNVVATDYNAINV